MALFKLIAASLSVAVLLCLGLAVRAYSDIVPFTDRDVTAACGRLSTLDFESAAPAKGFGKYPAAGLTVSDACFRASGGAKFGRGMVLVLSAHYAALNPLSAWYGNDDYNEKRAGEKIKR